MRSHLPLPPPQDSLTPGVPWSTAHHATTQSPWVRVAARRPGSRLAVSSGNGRGRSPASSAVPGECRSTGWSRRHATFSCGQGACPATHALPGGQSRSRATVSRAVGQGPAQGWAGSGGGSIQRAGVCDCVALRTRVGLNLCPYRDAVVPLLDRGHAGRLGSWSDHDQMAILWRREPVATRRNEDQ